AKTEEGVAVASQKDQKPAEEKKLAAPNDKKEAQEKSSDQTPANVAVTATTTTTTTSTLVTLAQAPAKTPAQAAAPAPAPALKSVQETQVTQKPATAVAPKSSVPPLLKKSESGSADH